MREFRKYIYKVKFLSFSKSLSSLVFLLSLANLLYAQKEIQFSFGGAQDDFARMALQTDDKGFIILGTTESYGQGGQDILLARTDSTGNIVWSKTLGQNTRDAGYTIKKDHSGGYILIGWVLNGGSSLDDWYVLKIDDSGKIIQEKFFGGSDDDEIMNFELTDDGGYIFSGSSRNYPGGGTSSIWIVKTDVNLTPQWNKTYNTSLGEHSRQIHETSDGHFIFLGDRYNTAQSTNAIMMYLTSVGDALWVKEVSGAGVDYGWDVLILDDGNFLFVGYTGSYGAGGTDIMVYKMSPAGTLLWAKTYGGNGDEEAYCIAKGLDDNILISGQTTSFGQGGSDLILINIDGNGSLIQATSNGGPLDETFAFVSAASDSGYVVSAGTESFGNGGQDVFVIKTDKQGNSCCGELISGLVVQNIGLPISNVTADISSGMGLPTHNIVDHNISPPSDLLCYDGIEIFGEDTVCASGGPFKYYLSPNLDFNFSWSLPPDAIVTSSMGDTVIFVQFGIQSGYIYAYHTNGCNAAPFDSIYVQVFEDALANAGSDEVSCKGNPWDFNNSAIQPTAAAYDSLLWSGGSGNFSDPKILRPVYFPSASELGTINLTLIAYGSNACGDGSDDMQLTITLGPDINIGNDTSICGTPGNYALFDAGPGFDYYLWQDGSTEQSYEAINPGEYWVRVTDSHGCQNSDTALLNVIQLPELTLGNDTLACGEFSMLLDAGIGFDQYTWQDGSSSQQLMATNYGMYWVDAYKDGCAQSDTIIISEECPSNLWFPNVFTPNSDGVNDRFLPVYEYVDHYEIYVYNRWGQLIYKSENIDDGWDGKYKGRDCPSGVFFFVANYFDAFQKINKEITGSITLLR